MATTNKNSNALTTIRESAASHTLSSMKAALLSQMVFILLFLQNLLFELRNFLLEMGFASFSTITLVADPGVGKTPTVEAIYRPDDTITLFNTPKKFEKLALKSTGRLACDDLLDANSQAERERLKLNYDVCVRYSFNGTIAPAVLTAEADAINSMINRSGRDRIIPLFCGKGIKNSDYANALSYIQDHPDELDEFMLYFIDEVENHLPSKAEYLAMLTAYRAKYSNIAVNSKRTDMSFGLYFTAIILNNAVVRANGVPFFDQKQLEDINHYALTTSFGCDTSELSVVEDTLQHFIRRGIRPYAPVPEGVCDNFARNGCSKCVRGSGQFCRFGGSGCDYDEITVYNPEHLVLRYDDSSNAILLTSPESIFQYHRPYKTPSILIIDSSILVNGMNAELENRALKTGESITYFTNQKLHQSLAEINRCMTRPNGKTLRYSLDYPCYTSEGYSTSSVVALLLKPEETQYLKAHAVERQYVPSIWECVPHSASIARTLKKTFSSLTLRSGGVGVINKRTKK